MGSGFIAGRELQLAGMQELTNKSSSQHFFLRILKVIIQVDPMLLLEVLRLDVIDIEVLHYTMQGLRFLALLDGLHEKLLNDCHLCLMLHSTHQWKSSSHYLFLIKLLRHIVISV